MTRVDDALNVERQAEERRDNCKASLRNHSWKLFGLGMTVAGILIYFTYGYALDTSKDLKDSKVAIFNQLSEMTADQRVMALHIKQIFETVVPQPPPKK